jgi:hypothetical protein
MNIQDCFLSLLLFILAIHIIYCYYFLTLMLDIYEKQEYNYTNNYTYKPNISYVRI